MTAEEICTLRKRTGWSQSEMARYLGVAPASVHRWENGKARPDDYRLATLVQLRRRLRSMSPEERDQFIRTLVTAAVTGGIIALLAHLFRDAETPL